MQQSARFFLCTRDRPYFVRRSLLSLSQACRAAARGPLTDNVPVFILDDSTLAQHSVVLRNLVRQLRPAIRPLHPVLIGSSSQRRHITTLLRDLPEDLDRVKHSFIRTLGSGPWDLAGVRNLAFLLGYSVSACDDLMILLDDDIVFSPTTYRGTRYNIDGGGALCELVAHTPRGGQVAAGVHYVGEMDTSLLDHLSICMRALPPSEHSADSLSTVRLHLFPRLGMRWPKHINQNDRTALHEGPSISGAVLSTTPAAVASHPLPRCYNEDWIWLRLLGSHDQSCLPISRPLLHAGPIRTRVSLDLLAYQQRGEILYAVFNQLLLRWQENGHGKPSDPIQWCTTHLAPEQFARAQHEAIADIRRMQKSLRTLTACPSPHAATNWLTPTTVALSRLEAYVTAIRLDTLYAFTMRYLASVRSWRRLMRYSRLRLHNILHDWEEAE